LGGWKFPNFQFTLHPGRLTWNLTITQLKKKIIFQTIIFRFQPLIFQGVNGNPTSDIFTSHLGNGKELSPSAFGATILRGPNLWDENSCQLLGSS